MSYIKPLIFSCILLLFHLFPSTGYLNRKQLTDVVLIAGTMHIPAHRLVLSSVSDYFAAMFTHDVQEANKEEIELKGLDAAALKACIQYIYTG